MLSKKDFVPVLQENISNILGVKVSKEKAWEVFKSIIPSAFDTIVENYKAHGSPKLERGKTCNELVLSLAGVGRFEIITAGTKKSKAEAGYDVDPRARVYVSSAIQNKIYADLGYDFEVGVPVKTENPEEQAEPETAEVDDAFDIGFEEI